MQCRRLARCVFPVAAGLEIMTPDSCFYYRSPESCNISIKVLSSPSQIASVAHTAVWCADTDAVLLYS